MTDDVDADRSESEPEPRAEGVPADVDFEDLSIPQRAFVAAVQNPSRGVLVAGLFAIAFSFYVAFWLVLPRVAALLSGLAAVIALVGVGLYYLIARVL